MVVPEWLSTARTNWRSGIWVVVAVGACAFAIAASAFVRQGVAPSDSERTTRGFLASWNQADYRQAYTYLDTSIASDTFVDAMAHTAAPLRDLRFERVVQQDHGSAIIAYSASVPDPISAATGVVVANSTRYGPTCVDSNLRGARYVRITDTLAVGRDGSGTWKIGFRAKSEPLNRGAAALALAFDLAPGQIFDRLGPAVDPRSKNYDDLALTQSLATYQADVGALPVEDPGESSPSMAQIRIKGVGQACGTVAPTS